MQVAAAAAAASTSGRAPVDTQADRLDSLMEQVLAHLQWRCAQGQLGEAWASMLGSFERALLHAHRSKFTQFLLFYLAKQVGRSWQPRNSCHIVIDACCCGRGQCWQRISRAGVGSVPPWACLTPAVQTTLQQNKGPGTV